VRADGRVRTCREGDASAIASIYNEYIRDTVITFEETPVSTDEMRRRIGEVGARYPWLAYEHDGAVVGWAYATAWKTRSAYRFSVETTVYLAPSHCGHGIGRALYEALIAELKTRKIHCAVGCIALPNPPSIALHEKLGFEKVAHFAEVGWKFDRWVDVGYWQLTL
jgi:L-amino acid N-acyltransferase YncA